MYIQHNSQSDLLKYKIRSLLKPLRNGKQWLARTSETGLWLLLWVHFQWLFPTIMLASRCYLNLSSTLGLQIQSLLFSVPVKPFSWELHDYLSSLLRVNAIPSKPLFEIALTPTPFPSSCFVFSKPLIHIWFVFCSTATCGPHSASYPLLHEDKEFLYLCPQCLEQCLTYCGGLVNICWINDWRNEMHLINLNVDETKKYNIAEICKLSNFYLNSFCILSLLRSKSNSFLVKIEKLKIRKNQS